MNVTPPGQSSAKKKEIHLDTSPIRIKEILAATDFSEEATLATKVAARLAKHFRCGLLVLHAVTPQVYASRDGVLPVVQEIGIEHDQRRLHAYAGKIPQLRITKHEEIVLPEPAADAISAVVEKRGIDLVVLGSSGRNGLGKLVLGSVAEAAIRRLHCPVLVVGSRCLIGHGSLKAIVLATSLPAGSLRAAQYAMSIVREFGATLTVMHVLPKHISERDMPSEKQSATDILRQLVPDYAEVEKHVRFEIAVGDRAEEIVHVANHSKAGLIVMGVREHSVLADHAPWATLSEVIRSAHCPVLAVQSHLV